MAFLMILMSFIIAQPGIDVPGTISFQGMLTDSEGMTYDAGIYNLTFRLIRDINEDSEQTLWEEQYSIAITNNGVFSVTLGETNPLPLNLSANDLLEIQVGEEILSPRQSLTSVPFALRSSNSEQAIQALTADTAHFSLNAHHSQFSDTSLVSMNAPMADTALFAHLALYATSSDIS